MLNVYVPRPDSDLEDVVWVGSGIVGSRADTSGRLRVDYEGDRDRYPRYAERVRRAADRHRWSDEHREGYPTRASAHVDEGQVIAVGRYDTANHRVVVDDEAALKEWLGVDDLSADELRAKAN